MADANLGGVLADSLAGTHGQSSKIAGGQSNSTLHFLQQNLVNLDAADSGHNPIFDIQMGLDHEESPIEHTDGNKRARMISSSTTISSVQDFNAEMRVSSEVPPNIISAGLMNQVQPQILCFPFRFELYPFPSSQFPAEQISGKESLNLDPIGFPRLGSLLWELIYSRENWVLNSTSNK
ncbi:hypothetical protein V6N13_088614 [Hibiscus sabdariffa]